MADARSYIDRFSSLEGVLAVIVGVGAIVYPIGFVQLVARVGFGSTNDFTTAWHVASLVPAVEVAGYGLQGLASMWLFFLFAPAFLILAKARPLDETRSLGEYLAAMFSSRSLILLYVAAVVGAAGLGYSEHRTWQGTLRTSSLVAMGTFVGMISAVYRSRRALLGVVLMTAIVYLAGSVSAVLTASELHNPRLPHIEVGAQKGWLVSHSEGYWYVLMNTGRLVAVRDDNTTVIITP